MDKLIKFICDCDAIVASQVAARLLIAREIHAMLSSPRMFKCTWNSLTDPQLAYRNIPRSEYEVSFLPPSVHNGQLKLLLNEIEFLT